MHEINPDASSIRTNNKIPLLLKQPQLPLPLVPLPLGLREKHVRSDAKHLRELALGEVQLALELFDWTSINKRCRDFRNALVSVALESPPSPMGE